MICCSPLEKHFERADEPVTGKLIPIRDNLYLWADIANVYILKDGDAAILFDLGDGGVLEHLKDIGVSKIEWVLFTHHHREQTQGYPKVKPWSPQIAVPEQERLLFEQPSSFRKMNSSLEDQYAVHGSSYVRPSIVPIRVDRGLLDMDIFTWRGYEITCLKTPGNSPGSMSYFIDTSAGRIAITGDVMLDGARMHNWFDSEWDYGFATGLYVLHNSARLIQEFNPVLLLPSHGPLIRDPKEQLTNYQKKLKDLIPALLRGYDVYNLTSSFQDKVSKPTEVPFIWQVSPHIYKFKGPTFFVNFTLILADNGHALAVDCGLLDEAFLNKTLDLMSQRLGLKKIDAVLISHMHGDHFLQVPFLKKKYGTEVWALERMANQLQRPFDYDYAALIPAYDKGFDSIKVDRFLRAGEKIIWEGYEFTVDWMPGQTEFAMGFHGKIDERYVIFTGDNIFADSEDVSHNGHEALVARNSAILEEGYMVGAQLLKDLNPDIIIGGHSFVMDKPHELIERYYQWSFHMRDLLQDLSSFEDYRYWFDPYWVKAEPYRNKMKGGDTLELQIKVRNFEHVKDTHVVEIHTPQGISCDPCTLADTLNANSTGIYPVRIIAAKDIAPDLYILGLDVTLNGKRHGEWFDALIEIQP